MPVCVGYLKPAINPKWRQRTIESTISIIGEHLARSADPIDGIAFSGLSGSLIALPVADALELPFAYVRRDNEGCASSILVESDADIKNYIIIDDLISTGATCKRIMSRMKVAHPGSRCVAAFMYYGLTGYNTEADTHTIGVPVFYTGIREP